LNLIFQNTALIPNIYAAHFCKSTWGDPHLFRPERFLTSSGEINQKVADLVIPFGGGNLQIEVKYFQVMEMLKKKLFR